jgi:small conductance mechanosensitive channel
MEGILSWFGNLHGLARIVAIMLVAGLGHFMVRGIRRWGERVMAPAHAPGLTTKMAFTRRYPKLATLTSLTVSALTVTIYFAALGLILDELNVSLTAYVATASVIGLAVGFGSQSLVQDVVVGLTLVFTDAMDIGDVVEVPGQIGRVEEIGLRFTTLVNFKGQRVYVPNRNIAVISQYRGGVVRAYTDIQIPKTSDASRVIDLVDRIARGMRAQHPAIILSDPEVFGVREATPADWSYLRLKFRLWPGQEPLIHETFKQRVVTALKDVDPDFAAWMVDITFRVE